MILTGFLIQDFLINPRRHQRIKVVFINIFSNATIGQHFGQVFFGQVSFTDPRNVFVLLFGTGCNKNKKKKEKVNISHPITSTTDHLTTRLSK